MPTQTLSTQSPVTLALTNRAGVIGTLTIENVLAETYTFTSTPTKYPIEDGSVITDHIVNEPEKIKLDCLISDSPIGQTPGDFSQSAFDQLYTMWSNKQVVSVDTKFLVYTNMAITSITIPRTPQTGQAIQFSVELSKIKTISASSANADQFANSIVTQALDTQNMGIRPGQPLPPAPPVPPVVTAPAVTAPEHIATPQDLQALSLLTPIYENVANFATNTTGFLTPEQFHNIISFVTHGGI